MNYLVPKKVFVSPRAMEYEYTKKIINSILNANGNTTVLYLDKKRFNSEEIRGKNRLILDVNLGNFVRRCPGTKYAFCCNYYNLDVAEGCPMDCSYCFLQTYKKSDTPMLYVNFDDMMSELEKKIKEYPNLRIGSGELSDSFAFSDFYNEHNLMLIDFFKKHSKAILELKTKREAHRYIPEKGYENCVISFTLNSKTVEKEELLAESVEKRIESAKIACEMGYTVSFHFDPIVIYPGFEEEYHRVVLKLLKSVPHKKIRWISLGLLRFDENLKLVVYKKNRNSVLFVHEHFRSLDGKLRYPAPKRKKVFSMFLNWIRRESSIEIPVYMCMEFKNIWDKVFGINPYSCPVLHEVYGFKKN